MPVPSEFLGRMQATKGLEEFFSEGHVESGAVIAHEIRLFALVHGLAELYFSLRMALGVFPGVSNKVFQCRPQEVLVPVDLEPILDNEFYACAPAAVILSWSAISLARALRSNFSRRIALRVTRDRPRRSLMSSPMRWLAGAHAVKKNPCLTSSNRSA